MAVLKECHQRLLKCCCSDGCMPSKSAAEVMAALKDCSAENDGHLQRLEKKDCRKDPNETPLKSREKTILFLSWAQGSHLWI